MRFCAKEKSLSRKASAILLSWMRAVLFMSCVYLLFYCSFGGGRRACLGECGRDVGRRVDEGSAGVVDWNAYKLESPPISSEGAKLEVVFLGLLGELIVEAEVHA